MTSDSVRSPRAALWSWVIVSVLIAVGLAVMARQIGETGVWISWKDARWYFRSGVSLAEDLGYTVPIYRIAEDALEWIPLTHYPPLVSTFYALGIRLGIAPETVPGIVNLIAWGLFITGVALLSARVAQRASAAAWGVTLALLTWPYWSPFQAALSDPIFYSILVWFAYFLTDSKDRNRVWWWACTLILLTLLLLTRYVAIYIYAGIFLWWTVVRWREVAFRRLVGEWFLWGLPALPLGAWLIRNWFLSGYLFGPGHSTDRPLPFVEAQFWVFVQSVWIIFPSVWPMDTVRMLGLAPIIGAGVALIVIALLVLCKYRNWLWLWHPLHTPLPALILAYISVFTIFSFTLSYAMTQRYMAVTLALLQPLILGSLILTWQKKPWVLPSGYLLLHAVLLLAVTGAGLTPPWMGNGPARTLDRSRYFPDVDVGLAAMSHETAVISNAPDFFIDRPIVAGDYPLQEWFQMGTCQTRHPVLLVVVNWDRWSTPAVEKPGFLPPDALNNAIQTKCPNLEPLQMQRATLYHLANATVRSE